MPTPLSKLAPHAEPHFSSFAAEERPALAPVINAIFCRWAWIEHQQEVIFLNLIGGSSDAAVAIFNSLQAERTKRDALFAAAKATLDNLDYSCFEIVMAIVRSAQQQRNKIAHHVWGTCDELPNHLLLTNPRNLSEEVDWMVKILSYSKQDDTDSTSKLGLKTKSKRYKHSRVFAYDIRDFKSLREELLDAEVVLIHFYFILFARISPEETPAPKSSRHKTPGTTSFARRQLIASGPFRKARAQTRDSRRKTPPPPHG